MTELKPCPFCGMPPLKSRAGEVAFIIHCGNADCEAKCEITGASPEGVIAAWNHRVVPTQSHSASQLTDTLIQAAVDFELGRIGNPAYYAAKRAVEQAIEAREHAQHASAKGFPWAGNLSADVRSNPVHVLADGLPLIDEKGTCWAVVFPDARGFYDHASTMVAALADSRSPAENANASDIAKVLNTALSMGHAEQMARIILQKFDVRPK